MATYGEIQTRVERRVIDLPSAVAAEVPALVAEAVRELQDGYDFIIMEALGGPYTTVASTRALVAKPSDWKKPRGDPYMEFDVNGRVKDIPWASSRMAVLDLIPPEDTGMPKYLLLGEPTDEAGAQSIEIWPLTDTNSDYSDGEYRLYVPYWKYLTTLSDDADTNWFTVNAELYIIHNATARAFELDWDEERMSIHKQLAAEQLKRVKMLDKTMRLAKNDTLMFHKGALAPRLRT